MFGFKGMYKTYPGGIACKDNNYWRKSEAVGDHEKETMIKQN